MSLFDAMAISSSGLAAQRTRIQLLIENLANSETTRTPEGGPYRRRDAVFTSEPLPASFQAVLSGNLGEPLAGVRVAEVTVDERSPDRRYLPAHPDADAEGYVSFPRINPVEDMVDLTAAVRSYQANLAAMGAAKDMMRRSLDLVRS
ncbi:MAG TPA: flagellar basal body rod protein FlgC [Bryobacterales bacterium]|nr:flagellar basal body rod protein FlgC [Bryobacterales bacterium]